MAGARVIAFEPNRELCAAMAASVRATAWRTASRVRRSGSAMRPGGRVSPKPSRRTSAPKTLALGEGEIEVATLDGLGIEGPVRAIKIDVEGMEAAVLRGCRARISRDRPVLYVECLDEGDVPADRRIWAQGMGYTHLGGLQRDTDPSFPAPPRR